MKYLAFIISLMSVVYAYAKTDAMGEITYQYMVDDKGAVTLWKPLRSKLILNEESGKSVDEHKMIVEKALKNRNDVTLFDFGDMFKKGAKKAMDTTVSIVKNESFQKAAAAAGAAAVAVGAIAGTYAGIKNMDTKDDEDDINISRPVIGDRGTGQFTNGAGASTGPKDLDERYKGKFKPVGK